MQKYSTTEELMHYGVKGMKWGVRRYQNNDGTLNSAGRKRYQPTSSDSAVTKKVKKDLGSLSESEFRKKYGTSTTTYMKRVDKYGDPYMNAPRARMGKFLNKQAENNANRYQKRALVKKQKTEVPKKDLVKSTNAKTLYKNKDRLTDAEMRDRINRIQMEQNLYKLSKTQPSVSNSGKKMASSIAGRFGNAFLNAVVQESVSYALPTIRRTIRRR